MIYLLPRPWSIGISPGTAHIHSNLSHFRLPLTGTPHPLDSGVFALIPHPSLWPSPLASVLPSLPVKHHMVLLNDSFLELHFLLPAGPSGPLENLFLCFKWVSFLISPRNYWKYHHLSRFLPTTDPSCFASHFPKKKMKAIKHTLWLPFHCGISVPPPPPLHYLRGRTWLWFAKISHLPEVNPQVPLFLAPLTSFPRIVPMWSFILSFSTDSFACLSL